MVISPAWTVHYPLMSLYARGDFLASQSSKLEYDGMIIVGNRELRRDKVALALEYLLDTYIILARDGS